MFVFFIVLVFSGTCLSDDTTIGVLCRDVCNPKCKNVTNSKLDVVRMNMVSSTLDLERGSKRCLVHKWHSFTFLQITAVILQHHKLMCVFIFI